MTEQQLKEMKMFHAKEILDKKFTENPPVAKYLVMQDASISNAKMDNLVKAMNVLHGMGYSKPQLSVVKDGNMVLGYILMERLVNQE